MRATEACFKPCPSGGVCEAVQVWLRPADDAGVGLRRRKRLAHLAVDFTGNAVGYQGERSGDGGTGRNGALHRHCRYSDGSSKDVTAAALWSPTYSEGWDPVSRASFALSFTSPGVTAARLRGERNLFALYEGKRGMMNVLVLEPGTFKLSGGVSDSSGGLLDDVTVEVLSGTGKGLKATTNNIGQYGLYGVAGPVQLRTSADGFRAQIRDVIVTGNGGPEPFALTPVETPADVSGTWTMTVRSSPRMSRRSARHRARPHVRGAAHPTRHDAPVEDQQPDPRAWRRELGLRQYRPGLPRTACISRGH